MIHPLLVALAAMIPCFAPPTDEVEDEFVLDEFSIEELMALEVTTVSRKATSLRDAPAAVYVITREDIRRSGHTSIPELMRLVPGVHVARINSSSWAIGVRGANNTGRFADKLLVMIDGRTIYTNLFSGVWWDAHDLLLEDIERIEVIRGPGGAMWGANAVNGIINIITRTAADTQGHYATTTVGDEDRGIVGYRYGGKLGESGHWRGWAKAFSRDASRAVAGGEHPDPWQYGRVGARGEWSANDRDSFMVQGDAYDGNVRVINLLTTSVPPYDGTYKGKFENRGGYIQGRWSRRQSERSDFDLRAYYDHTTRDAPMLRVDRKVFDFDFQHRYRFGERHELMWGAGFRHVHYSSKGTPGLFFDPDHRNDSLVSVFLQDEFALREDLVLTVGAKLEHNDFTDFEFQPSVRVLWTISEGQSVWGAVSRAVRTPSIANRSVFAPIDVIPGSPATVFALVGTDDYDAEDLLSFEVGYRWAVVEDLSADVTAFFHDYRGLQSIDAGTPYFDGVNTIVPMFVEDNRDAQAFGLEGAATWDVTNDWRVYASVAVMDFEEHLEGASVQGVALDGESMAADYLVHLRSYHDLTEDLELDFGLYAVDGLQNLGVRNYWRADIRMGWRPTDSLEVSLVAQNACDPEHREFGTEPFSTASEIERSLYVRLSWHP